MNENANPIATCARLNAIQKVSRVVRVLCLVVLAVQLFLTIKFILTPTSMFEASDLAKRQFEQSSMDIPAASKIASPNVKGEPIRPVLIVRRSYQFGGSFMKLEDYNHFKSGFKWLYRPIVFIYFAFLALGIWILYRLFGLYEKGYVFTADTVRYIRYIGYWLIAAAVLSNAFELSKVIWSPLPDSHLRLDEFFLGGVLVVLISWIMDEGRKLQEEQELTV